MSIDIRQLHIGSHIAINGERERVRGLDEDNGLIVRFPAEYVMASEVEPIPITPALLEELGFEKETWPEYDDMTAYKKKIGDGVYRIEIMSPDWAGFSYGYTEIYGITAKFHCWSMPTPYLHNLEQFIYDVTQKELIKD